MAEEMVVKETLTQEMIEAGAELTRLLDQSSLVVSASLWLYMPESNVWRLIIVSPEVRTLGPRKVYQKVQSVLSKASMKQYPVALKDISVAGDDDPIISLLRIAIRTNGGIAGIRFSKNTINGHFVEDAFIYRMT
jgi:hypothetical protein